MVHLRNCTNALCIIFSFCVLQSSSIRCKFVCLRTCGTHQGCCCGACCGTYHTGNTGDKLIHGFLGHGAHAYGKRTWFSTHIKKCGGGRGAAFSLKTAAVHATDDKKKPAMALQVAKKLMHDGGNAKKSSHSFMLSGNKVNKEVS